MSKTGKTVMLSGKKKANKATHFIQPVKACKGGFYIYQAVLGERNLELLSSLLQRWLFLKMLLVILTVKERDKLNS